MSMKRSFIMNKKFSLNSSTIEQRNYGSSKNLEDSSSDLLSDSSFLLNQVSITSNDLNDEQLTLTKKKMGVQLSILQKNIFFESKRNINEKPKRINRSNQGNNNKPIKRRSFTINQSPFANEQKNSKNIQKQNVTQFTSTQPITSADLQQIRKFDKDIYQLYLDLYNDYKQELQIKKERDNFIQQLKDNIMQKQHEQKLLHQQIDIAVSQQKQMEEVFKEKQMNFITNMRQKMLDTI